jgi:cation transport ATPase
MPSENTSSPGRRNVSIRQFLTDAAGLGFAFWLIGYILGILLFFTPLGGIMGWVLFVCLTPVMAAVTYQWFFYRGLPMAYFAKIAVAWTAIAIVSDYLFIVLLFHPAAYYQPDVFVYYAVMFLLPIGVGWYLQGHRQARARAPACKEGHMRIKRL